MRNRKAFVSCAVVAVVLLAAAGLMAGDPPPPMSCAATDFYGTQQWTVQVTKGPWRVNCGGPFTSEVPGGACSGIEYTVNGSADHVWTLIRAEAGISYVGGSTTIAAPCVGDTVTGFGQYSCHERAIRLNPVADTQVFQVVLDGSRPALATSIQVRKGQKSIGSCKIAGLGVAEEVTTADACVSSCGNFHPKQTILKEEVLRFKTGTGKECFARFVRDLNTGQVIENETGLDLDRSSPGCQFERADVSQLQLFLDGVPIGSSPSDSFGGGQHGDGILSTGSDSCTTRVIGGRVYTWGAPCPY